MITFESAKSYQEIPDSLVLLCLKEIIKKPVNSSRYVLPPEIGGLIAVAFKNHALANKFSSQECEHFFRQFKHKYIPLARIDFSHLPITESFFLDFLEEYQEQLDEVDISSIRDFTFTDLRKLNRCLKNNTSPKTLIIGDTYSSAFAESEWSPYTSEKDLFDNDLKLKKLVLQRLYSNNRSINSRDEFTINRRLSRYLTPTMSNSLKYLDMSDSLIGKGTALMQLESLEILILYNCSMVFPDVISTICQLKQLRALDVSRLAIDSDERYSTGDLSPEDPKLLDLIVNRLPNLESLDISGTNLVGGKDRNISAFESRANQPFKFLGLFYTGNDAAYRSCLPAQQVAGDATESQVLNACEAYANRPDQLCKALNQVYNLYKYVSPGDTFNDVDRALEVVLPFLTKHLHNEQVIIYTTAALWCIVKINVTTGNLNDARVRRTITSRLLDVMHYHKTNRVILTNGGLTLLFLPDIICEHSRVASISLLMCRDSDARTQGFGTTLLNTLACQVGGDQKVFIGRLEAIETMIDIIKSKIDENTCDEILEAAWSTLWNITDETPINCQRFLEFSGLDAYETCMDRFTDNKEVLRNMMGLLGNVAECKLLRVNFMKEQYIQRFLKLLSSNIDGIECSYNACGIIAHLVSDGQEFWDRHLSGASITRQSILMEMRRQIARWPINSRRNINYRSFQPIVRLLEPDVVAEAQYWAAFALANLTRVNPSKYCPMLLPFDGLKKLRALARPGMTKSFVQNLAMIVVYQYERFQSEKTLHGLEQCDSVDLNVVKNFRADPNQNDGTSEMGEIIM